MSIQLKKHFYLPVIALFAVLAFMSCQKDLDFQTTTPVDPGTETPDLTSRVTSSVSGFVTDENDVAVAGASVKVGTATITTDAYGYFSVRNADVIKNAATVTITRPGYFKGIKTYIAETGKSAFFRIKLIPKTASGTIPSATGGNVSLTSGLIVALPANAVVDAASGAAYSGTIHVAAYWIDPAGADLNKIMPGDLRALNADGALRTLRTYGMAAVELTGDGGQLLQIATGKKATLTENIPASLSASAPNTIPLWYFDENLGLWKEDGTATKTGNTYVGEVSHFSFWNYDVPANYVQFNCTVLDAGGSPLPYVLVRITEAGGLSATGYTDSSGYVAGAVPDNAQLTLEVYSGNSCGLSAYSQSFTTTTTNISLGNVTVTNSSSMIAAQVTGNVIDCNSLPVSNGFVMVTINNQFTRYNLSATGLYDFSTMICTSPSNINIVAEDAGAGVQSQPLTTTITGGANNIPVIQACGAAATEFVTYSLNGVTHTIAAPDASFFHSVSAGQSTLINGVSSSSSDNIDLQFASDSAMHVGSSFPLIVLSGGQIGNQFALVPAGTVLVNITEYGNVGEYISGNFDGLLATQTTPVTNVGVVCTFRVKRAN